MTWWWLALAWAGSEAQLEVARSHLARGEAVEARAQAAEVLASTPTGEDLADAVDIYVGASAWQGRARQALVEVASFDVPATPWADEPARLARLVAGMEEKEALALSQSLAERFPEHPELQAGLWGLAATKKLVKARKPYLSLPSGASDAYALRLQRLHRQVGAPEDPELTARVAGLGPSVRPRLDDVQLHEQARAVFGGEPLQARNADEAMAIATRAHQMFMDAGRALEAVAMWDAVLDSTIDPGAHALRAHAAVAGGAPAAVDLTLLSQPTEHDLPLQDAERLLHHAGQLYIAAARGGAEADTRLAWADAVTGTVLGGVPPDGAVSEALRDATRGQLAPTVEAAMKGMAAAPDAEALVAAEGEVRWAMAASATSAGSALKQRGLFELTLAELFAQAAARAQALGASELVLRYGLLANALGVESNDLPRWIGDAAHAEGHTAAAFAWWARARAAGHDDLDEALGKAYDGLGDPLAVATEVAGAPGSRAVAEAVAADAPRTRRSVAPRGSTPSVKVGQAVPPWSVHTATGTLSSASLEGRVVVLSFWSADCTTCLDQLPTLATLTKGLRRSGRDVVLVAVSTDTDDGPYQDVFRLGQRWGELARAPELAESFGVRRVPSTWVIDRTGVATYFVDYRVSADELERVILLSYQ